MTATAPRDGEDAANSLPDPLAAALATIDSELRRCGLSRIGPPEEVRNWNIAAVLRVPTDGAPVWFKTVPAIFRHEGRLTEWLAGLVPDAVPGVISAGDGWLLTHEMAEEAVGPVGHPLERLAHMQLAMAGRTRELRALGCPDRGLGRIVTDMEALTERADLLAGADRAALRRVLGPLAAMCEQTAAAGLPTTLVHGDVHTGNVRWTADGWLLFDWTDACVGHPFVDLAQPLAEADEEQRSRISARYGAVWEQAVPASRVEQALRTAPAIGAAFHAGSHMRIIDAVGRTGDLDSSLVMWVHRLVLAVSEQT
ncbi:aminoglycoside phosphotransferase family protein [Kitasatospora aureofaciens]|uniref:aminoglycoside phosphotransferase family protein n=1 Tax=Kitasatospora aureofaciens TaxID=1894 RepID=UPI0037C670A7